MQFIELALRMCAPSDMQCAGRIYHGDQWTDEEKAALEAVFAKHNQPVIVDSMYNNWVCWLYRGGTIGDHFAVRRATWEFGDICGTSVDEVAVKLDAYFENRK